MEEKQRSCSETESEQEEMQKRAPQFIFKELRDVKKMVSGQNCLYSKVGCFARGGLSVEDFWNVKED